MDVTITKYSGETTGRKVNLSSEVFDIEPNDHAIWLDVKSHLANQRQGTHKSKQRNEITGSSKKIKKQKGTGGARKGNLRNPLYKGGGSIFGPKPHKYDIKLNQKVKTLAKMSALAYKAKENAIVVVEDINMYAPKTSTFTTMLKSLGVNGKKSLFVIPEDNYNLYLSLRNVANVNGTLIRDINTYDIINANVLVLTENAAKVFTAEEVEA